jgi:hypothetical protein
MNFDQFFQLTLSPAFVFQRLNGLAFFNAALLLVGLNDKSCLRLVPGMLFEEYSGPIVFGCL